MRDVITVAEWCQWCREKGVSCRVKNAVINHFHCEDSISLRRMASDFRVKREVRIGYGRRTKTIYSWPRGLGAVGLANLKAALESDGYTVDWPGVEANDVRRSRIHSALKSASSDEIRLVEKALKLGV